MALAITHRVTPLTWKERAIQSFSLPKFVMFSWFDAGV
jgi:hypothetical protein